ncbi:hypothetical protein T439DRAFT_325127 [Meredithblackwellia eburnea MCA 4105]
MDQLPPEILDSILSLVPPPLLQSTTLSLLRTLGQHASISRALLWRHLRISREGQSWEAALALRQEVEDDSDFRKSVRTATVEAWREDPQMLINLIQSLPMVKSLHMTVGPLFQPEHLEEMLELPAWKPNMEQIWFRFNPYVMERSYYTFLKGAYFDSTALMLARWPVEAAPRLHRLAFVQDLPPNHGVVVKETPAFGIVNVEELVDELGNVSITPPESRSTTKTEGKMNFAQPIVFFQLSCITKLGISAIGHQITSLTLRLPRRNVLPPLTTLPTAFPSLSFLDISTTHILDDPRFPLLLRLHPYLTHVVLDRTTGLVGAREAEDQQLATVKWIGKCFGGVGASRAEEVLRAWRRLTKDRPTGLPAPGPGGPPPTSGAEQKKKRTGRSGYASMPRASRFGSSSSAPIPVIGSPEKVNGGFPFHSELPPQVKDILVVPPPPKIKSVGLGIFPLTPAATRSWRKSFNSGFNDSITKTIDKIEDHLARFERWRESGRIAAGTGRMVLLRDAVPPGADWVDWDCLSNENDPAFKKFCEENDLLVIGPQAALEIVRQLEEEVNCVLCTVPDCSGDAGLPHLQLSIISKEKKEVRELREKGLWEMEENQRRAWRRPVPEHELGCAHLEGRNRWGDEDAA